jgi:hypothetical protein
MNSRKYIVVVFAIFFTSVGFAQLPNYIPTSGLVGYWPFNGNANDESGNGNNGTVNGATLTTDRFGVANKAYNFNSNPQYISFPNGSASSLNITGNFTLSFWVKTTATTTNNGFLNLGDNVASPPNAGGIVSGLTSGGKFGIGIRGNWYSSITSVNDNNWHHLTSTYDSGILKIFIDGILNNTFNSISPPLSWNGNRTFGCRTDLFMNSNTNYIGQTDEISIWNRALTSNEVSGLYTSTPAPSLSIIPSNATICTGQSASLSLTSITNGAPCASTGLPSSLASGLVGYWPFCGNANDASGNGNNGTPMNGATLTSDRFGNANSAYSFDGLDDRIQVLLNSSILNNTTISVWYKSNSLNGGPFVHIGQDNGGNPYCDGYDIGKGGSTLNNQGNDLISGFSCIGYYDSDVSGMSNQWNLATLKKVNNQIFIYLNGTLVFSQNTVSSVTPSPFVFFGSTSSGFSTLYSGFLDDIGIWNRSLTDAEILQLYNQGQATYSWSPGGATTPSITVSPTATTTYTCTITQNGATTTQSQTITVNPLPTVNAGVDQTIFAGAQVTLAGSGATTYAWDNGVTNNTPFSANTTSTYTVTGTSNGCSATDAVLVTVLPAPTLTTTNTTLCAGQSSTLTATSASTGTPCASTGLSSSLTNGLVGYWPFCGNANDASGNGNNGTVNGATLSTDRFGNANSAYSFDGNSNWIDVPHSQVLEIFGSQNTSTISLWFYGYINQAGELIGKGFHSVNVPNFGNKYLAVTNDGLSYLLTLYNFSSLNSVRCPNNYFNTNQWYHLVFVRDASLKAFVNGTDISTAVNNTGWSTNYNAVLNNTTMSFGCRNVKNDNNVPFRDLFYNGKLDDIGIWNRALTASEIQQLYNQGQATYSWSPGGATTPSITVSPTVTTTYTCTITQGGATTTQSQTITVNPLPTVNAGADQTVFAGAQVTLAGSGATTYAWNNGVTNNTPFTASTTTTYTVTGTSNGCSSTDAVLVTVLPAPTLTTTNTTLCSGQSSTLTASSASTGTPCASTGLPGTLSNGLVGYWPFCGNANDASGNGNNGTPLNGVALTPDRYGIVNSAYQFDGVDDRIEISHNNNQLIYGAQSPVTFSCWILKNNNSISGDIISKGFHSSTFNLGNKYIAFGFDPILNKYNFSLYNQTTLNSIQSQSNTMANQWAHVVIVRDATIKMFIDGVDVGINANNAGWNIDYNAILNNSPINIGARNNLTAASTPFWSDFWDGKLDDIGIWNRALTASEIQQLYTQGQATYAWSPGGATTPSITVSPTATTTYTCTITQGGATTTQSQTITVNPLPTVNAGVDQTVFAGAQVTLAGSGATTYAWNNGVTNNTAFTASTTTTYTVTGTSNGCSSTDAVLVTVLPTPTITPTSATLCAGQSSTLTVASASTGTPCASTGLPSSLNNGLVGYWPFCGNANDASGNGNNGTVNGATLTTDRFGVSNKAYNFNGSSYIQINPNTGNFQTSNFTLSCWVYDPTAVGSGGALISKRNSPSNGNFFIMGWGNSPYYEINQTNSIDHFSYVYPQSFLNVWQCYTFTRTGNSIKIYLNGNLINTSTTSIVHNFSNLANLTFGARFNGTQPGEFFQGKIDDIGIWNRSLTDAEILQLYNQGQATYSWSPGGETTPSITVSPSATTTYTCTITQGGATTTESQTITVNSLPTVNAGNNQSICSGSSVTLSGSGANSYVWNNAVQNGVSFVPTSTQTYTLTGTATNGCTNTSSVIVTVNPLPTVNAGVDQTVFAGTQITLAGSGATTYTWDNGVTNNMPFTANATTTYTVTGTGNGCSATDAVLVTVLPAPTLTTTNTTLCAGQSSTLTAASVNTGTPCTSTGLPSSLTNGLVGYWPFCGNANDASGNGRNGIVNGATLTTDRFGNANSAYNFTGTTNNITIPNSQSLVSGSFSVSSWCTIDELMPSNYDAAIIGQLNGSVANDRKWLFGYRSIANQRGISYYLFNNSGNFFLANNYTLNWQPIQSQWYHISWVFESNNTIKTYVNGVLHSSVSVSQATFNNIANNVLIKIGNATDIDSPLPLPWNGKIDDVGIWNRVLTLGEIQQLYTTGEASYSWSPGGATTPSITVSPTATTTYTCTITQNGATTTQSQTITVNPLPTVNAGVDQTIFAGTQVTLAGSGATTYAWDNGVTNNTPFTANTTTTYTLTGTSNGCSSTDQVLVTVLPTPTITPTSATLCAGQSSTLTAASASTGTPCASTGLPSALTNGLVGYWPFCGNANDASGNGNNGTVNGATLTTDRFGNTNSAYNFDGINDYILTQSTNVTGSSSRTFSVWFNTFGSTNNQILTDEGGTSCGSGFAVISNAQNKMSFDNTCSPMDFNQNFTLSSWHHAVISFDNSIGTGLNGLKCYVDGVLINNTTISGAFLIVTGLIKPLTIGKSRLSNDQYFNGAIDDIGIWNRTLTSTEIQQLYTQGQATYSWSPGGATTPSITVSPTATTTYTCTITQNGATTTQSQTITVNPLPTVNAGVDQTIFAGTQVTLAGSGATTYAWDNGVTNNTPFTANTTTTYTLTGTSNGCSSTDQVLVTVLPTPTITPTSATLCAGQSSTLTVASASTGTPCASTGLPGTLSNGLVGYWPFCGNANDASGNGNNGTPLNGVALTPDRYGIVNSAYQFDGVDDRIEISHNNNQLIYGAQSPVTFSCWILKNNNSISGDIISKGFHSSTFNLGNKYIAFGFDPILNKYNFSLYNQTTLNSIQSQSNTTANQWAHVVIVRDATIKMFIDGVDVGINANNAGWNIDYNAILNNSPINIGARNNLTAASTPFWSNFWDGKLDDIGIWNRALTASEIQQLYTQGQATYSWSPGGATTASITVSPTTTTTYTCTITQGGATTTQSQTITVNPLPTVNAGVDQTVFAGAQVTLAGSGATTYAWDNGVTNNTPFTATTTTTYTLTGTSNGCSSTDAVLVTVLPTPTITPTSATLCAGQSSTLTVASASTGTPCASTGLLGTLNNGLVGYWPFCGNANDASGNGNNGTVNGPSLTTDRFGNANSAYFFNKVEQDIITIPNSSIYNFSSSFSVNLWYKLDSNQPQSTSGPDYNVFISKHQGGTLNSSFIVYTENVCMPTTYMTTVNDVIGYITYPTMCNTSDWHMISMTFGSSNLKMYFDGILYNTYSGLQNVKQTILPLLIGESMRGNIDDIGMWGRNLSSAEIQQLYNQGQATYSWSPGGATTPSITVSPTATTTYTCTITQGGATTTQSQTITVNPLPTVNAGVDQTVFAGAQVTLAGSGATTYAWDNGVTNNTPFTANTTTTYTLTGTSNACSSTDQVLVTVLPTPTITPTSATLCAGQSSTLTVASASTGTPCASTGLPSSLTNGLVGYWPFCGNANDASGNGNNGTVNGATLTPDRFGNANSAYSFDGVDDFIDLGTCSNIGYNPINISYSFWIRVSDIPNNNPYPIISRRHLDNNGYDWCTPRIEADNKLKFYKDDDGYAGTQATSNTLDLNQWTHFILTKNGDNLSLSANGILISSIVDPYILNGSPQNLFLGLQNAWGYFFKGQIDDIGIWNRALTASEIQQLYNQGQATYSWSPGGATTPSITVSPTATTTYTCTITQGGATTTQSQTITVNALPTVNAGVDQTVFAGAQVTLAGSGATTYAWDNGVTNNTPFTANTTTTYTVTGTSNGCSATDQVLVTVLPNASISSNPGTTLCAGQSTSLTANVSYSAAPCNASGLSGTLSNGLVGYWPFCGNANDASGNGNNGTVNGATLTTDRFGNANSAYSHAVPFQNILTTFPGISGTNSRTVSLWFNQQISNNTSDQWTLATYGGAGAGSGFGIFIFPGNNIGVDIGASYVSYNPTITLNQWHHISVTYSSSFGSTVGACNVYLDGVLLSSIANQYFPSTTLNTGTGAPNFSLGGNPSFAPQQFIGKLDDVGFWNRPLIASEIQQLYSQGQATYSWSPGGATTSSITVSPTATTTYTCTITQNGATTTQSQTITVNALPTVNAGNNQTVCAGTAVTLSGSGANTYVWNNGVQNGVSFVPTSTQTYTLTGTAANGCANTASVTVTVNPLPTVSAGSNQSVCIGSSVTLSGSGANTYVWNNGVQNGVSFVPTSTQTYTVTGTSTAGCSNTSSVVVTVNPLPTASISYTGSLVLCQGGSVALTASPGSSFLWSNGATTQTIQASQTGMYSVQVSNSSGCSATSTPVIVTVNPLPAPTITASGPLTICQGTSLTLTSTNAQSFVWSNAATTQTITISNTGSYTVTVVDDKGCSGTSAPIQVTVIPNPVVSISNLGSTNLCTGQNTILSATAGYTYLWSTGATTQNISVNSTGVYTVQASNPSGCTTASTGVNILVYPVPIATITPSGPTSFCQGGSVMLTSSPGNAYLWSNGATTQNAFITSTSTLTVTVTGQGGCTATSAPITVNANALPSAVISASGSTTFCAGGNVSLSVPSGNTYLWSTGASSSSIVVTNAGTYQVTVTNGFGCQVTSAAATINVNPIPTVNAGLDQSVCIGAQVTLIGSGANSMIWNNGVTNGVAFIPSSTQIYTVTGTNSFGCSATDNVLVTVNPLPIVSAGPNQSICTGSSVTLFGSGASSYTWDNGVVNGLPFNPSSTQTYTVTGTNTFGCVNTSSTTVTVNPLPIAIAGANTTITCLNGVSGAQIGASPVSGLVYSWIPSIGLNSTSISNPIANPALTTNYMLSVSNPLTGCSNTAFVTVNVNNTPPIANAGPSVNLTCLNSSTGVQIGTPAVSGYSYQWTPSTGLSASNVASPLANPAASTTYVLTVTNNSNGCTSSSPVQVNVNTDIPTVNAGPDQQLCAGQSIVLSASGIGATAYTWNNNVQNGVNFTPATTGIYTVTGTNSLTGCSSTDQVLVTVNALPNVSAGPNQSVCSGSSVILSGSGANFYSWNYGVTNGLAFNPTGTQTYTVIGTNSNGCTNSSSVLVSVNPVPNVSAGPNQTICSGNSITLIGYGASTYVWNNGVLNGVPFTPSSTQTYQVVGTSVNGCTNSASITVSVVPNSTPTITAGGPTLICQGGSVVLTASTGTSYQWKLNGVNIGGATSPSYTAAGSGNYTVVVSNTNGCSGTSPAITVSVSPNPIPTITAGGSTTLCTGGSVVLTASTGSTYQWKLNGVNISGATSSTYTATGAGNYTVVVSNANGCSGTSVTTAVTIAPNPTPTITASGPTTLCTGASIVLLASTGSTYQWKLNGVNINGATSSTYTATGAGNYTVVVSNTNGCSGTSAATTVTIAPNPTPTITAGGPTTLCTGGTVVLTASAGTSYQWKLNGVNISGATSPSFTATSTGNYTVVVSNGNGCSGTSAQTTVTISPNPTPTITASGSTSICTGGSVVLTSSTGSTYQWKLNGININGATSPSYTATSAGNYTVVVSNTNGCSGTSDQTIVTLSPNPTPTITASGSTSICTGGSVVLTASTGSTYQWKLNGVNINGAIASTYTASTAGNYTVVVSNVNGCTGTSAIVAITVVNTPAPFITVSGSTTICTGGSITLISSTGSSYQWLLNGVAIPAATNSSFIATSAGNYSVSLVNSTGCTVTSPELTITVNPIPSPTITANGSSTICPGTTVTLSTTAASSYQWKLNGGNIAGATSSSYTASVAGVYTVTVTNSTGCSGTSGAVNVTLAPAPNVSISTSGNTVLCPGSSVQIQATGTSGCTYQWIRNGMPIAGAVNATYNANQSGSIQVIATSAAGCQSTSNPIAVNVLSANLQANGSTTFCQGSSVVLQATIGAGYQYRLIKNGMMAAFPTSNSSFIITSTAAYSVQITTPSGCVLYSNTIQTQMIMNPTSSITASGGTSICSGSSVILQATTSGTAVTYQWKKNGVNIPNATSSSYNVTTAGSYNVMIANQACPITSATLSNSIVVTVNPTPQPTVSASSNIILLGGNVTLTTPIINGCNYQWQKFIGSSFMNITNATSNSHVTVQPGTFRVKVTNNFGCSGFSTGLVIGTSQMPENDGPEKSLLEEQLYVYPNPTVNSFQIKGIEELDSIQSLVLYDPLGSKICEYDLKMRSFDVSALARGMYYLEIVLPERRKVIHVEKQ